MLDTKWKNNKNSSFLLPAIAISAAVSILFMSLFPLFQKKAEESYIDPLTEQDFISDLFAVNLVQYKYLREKQIRSNTNTPIFIWKRRSRILTTAQRMTNRSRFPTRIRIWQCRHFFLPRENRLTASVYSLKACCPPWAK